MYGTYDVPFSIKEKELSIDVSKTDYGFLYSRKLADKPVLEKVILSEKSRIIINPVEPLNHPKHITNYLLLEFDKKISIAPHKEQSFYATFPIEIGVFIFTRQDFAPFDDISLIPAKYSLYGDPRIGIVARYYATSIYADIPEVNPLQQGVVHLTIKNSDSQWNTVSKIVLNAYGMKLYYNEKLVQLFTSMKIINEITAETDCYAPHSEKGFRKAMELYKSRKLSILSTKFVMMEGL